MIFFRFFFIFFCSSSLLSQTKNIEDSIYNIANQSLYKNINKSKELTNFLLSHASSKVYQKAAIDFSKISFLQGNYEDGIKSLYNIQTKNPSYSDPYVYMELSNYYRKMGFLNYAAKILDASGKTDQPLYYLYRANIELQPSSKIKFLKKGFALIHKTDIKYTPQLKEQFYIKLAENQISKDSSTYYYQLVLNSLENDKNNLLYRKAQISIEDLRSRNLGFNIEDLVALKSIDQKNIDIDSQRKLNLLLLCYFNSKNDIKSYKKSIHLLNKIDSLEDENIIEARNFITSNSYPIVKKNNNIEKLLYPLVIFFVFLFLVGLVLLRRLKKTQKKLMQISGSNYDLTIDDHIISVQKSLTPEKTEQDLLKKLEVFESEEKFLDKNISLPKLAEQFDTNIRYLSEIINKNKNKNYNQYINELRINFIIAQMENNSKYLNYKIQALAEESGFSSLSVFSVTFKSITGISPTAYAKRIKEQK